ncbi:MAG TPA: DUF4157 domain-containing protein, partial [Kofleriaceae bacterium]
MWPVPVQCKAIVGTPDDPAEREADAIADQVTRAPARSAARPAVIRAAVRAGHVSASCAKCAAADHEATGERAPHGAPRPLTHGGEPLPDAVRRELEQRLGFDFRRVRIHADSAAAASADAFEADAYTAGRHVVFGRGEYDPGTLQGRRLLAHELTHVVQQGHAGELAPGTRHAPGAQGADTIQRKCQKCEDEQPSIVQRAPRTAARRAPRRPRRAQQSIVEDGVRVSRGQMTKTQFLTTLRAELLQATEAELSPYGRTSRDCPYILRTINHYAARPVAMLLRLIQRFAHPPAGANARGLIAATVEKARLAARYLARNGSARAQRSSVHPDRPIAPHDPTAVRARLGAGSLLDRAVRTRLEPAFGRSFQDVRIHADASAAHLSDELGARAFTIGDHIAFGRGEYRPGTASGDTLIAH